MKKKPYLCVRKQKYYFKDKNMTIKKKKSYVSPSMQCIGLQMELLLCGSINSIKGMNSLPSEPGQSSFYRQNNSIW